MPPNPRPVNVAASRAKSMLVFLVHQIVGTWGIAFLAVFGIFSLFDFVPSSGGWQRSMRFVHWLLTENPFYPVQIMVGLYFGWLLGRRFQHRSMLWIWVLPLTILCYAFVTAFILIPEWTSILARPVTVQARLSYYFGWGCNPRAHCLDQLLITMPFYACLALTELDTLLTILSSTV